MLPNDQVPPAAAAAAFPPELHDLQYRVYPDCPYTEYQKEGCLVIRGITVSESHFIGRVLHTCWHHDRYTLSGILVNLNPETMDAHWNLGATGEPYRNPRPQRRSARGRAVKPVKKMKVVTVSICEI